MYAKKYNALVIKRRAQKSAKVDVIEEVKHKVTEIMVTPPHTTKTLGRKTMTELKDICCMRRI
jgi:hypothetical protein